MSKYEDRMQKQSPENQSIYYAWVDEFNRLGKTSLADYESTNTEFLEYNGNVSILNIKFKTIENFLSDHPIGLSRYQAKVQYLKNFLGFVSRKYKTKTRWDFGFDDLDVLLAKSGEVRASIISAEPLTVKQLMKLYNFFNENSKDREWLEVYTIFRLMYNYGLDKFDIANVNSNTYNFSTGDYHKNDSSSSILFDKEIVSIFQENGFFLPKNSTDVYKRLKKINKILGGNITQTVVEITKKQLKIRCPQCGRLINNDVSLFGYVQTDLLNLGTLIVCKKCMENEL
jgi:hypothetical protein